MFHESPLILLLCGSAVVSALMGNVDDAVSITIAIVIILTGPYSFLALTRLSNSTVFPHHFSWLRTGTTLRTVT